jgi:enterochelin esterase family protein
MVFTDGADFKDIVPPVFENLIAGGEMPVTLAVFISPGRQPNGRRVIRTEIEGIVGPLPPLGAQRQLEYDIRSERYSQFLLEEILPEVAASYSLRTDAESRAIAGMSSGGACAFTVAWERPDSFSKVLSWCGSFTNIGSFLPATRRLESGPTLIMNRSTSRLKESAADYPSLIRMTPRKPIRVFLQDGANDLNTYPGSWWLANQQMAASLAWAGYDCEFAWGKGFHSNKHGAAILPESLRWLWRDVQ